MNICYRGIKRVASIAHIEITDSMWNIMEQFIKFGLVGCLNAVVTLIIYDILIIIMGSKMYLVAQTIGYIGGIINSYFWNSKFVFLKKQSTNNVFLKMCVCYGSTYFVQMGLLYIFIEILRISSFLAPAIAIVITTPINFIVNKLWAFGEKR